MAKTWSCPFWRWEKGLCIHCEAATIRFANADARCAYIEKHCSNLPGWESCPLAADLERRYEKERPPE